MKQTIIISLFLITITASSISQTQPIWCYIQNCQLCDLSGVACYYCLANTDCCSYNCSKCIDSLTCTACDDGFTLEQNICVPNNSCTFQNGTCNNCSNQRCLGCIEGYWLSQAGNLCLICQPNCLNCTSVYICLACEATFFIQTYQNLSLCISCSSFNCKECTEYLNCTLCLPSFYLAENLTCQSCFPCSVCDSPTNCSQCNLTYYLVGSFCQPCPTNCTTCTDSQNCSGCLKGYYLNGSSCKPCNHPCDLCESEKNCTACLDSYYLNTSVCLPCGQYCLSCSNQTSCNSCMFLTTNTTCCSSNCFSCNTVDLIFSNCSTCLPGYFLNQTQVQINSSNYSLFSCEACPQDCLKCLSSNNCSTCVTSYYISSEGQCLSCSTSMPLCSKCSNNTSCLVCKQGQLLEGNCLCFSQQYFTGFSCSNCPNECSSCTNQVTCTGCQTNYQLQGSSCVIPSSSGFPWWAILLIVVAVTALAIVGRYMITQRECAIGNTAKKSLLIILIVCLGRARLGEKLSSTGEVQVFSCSDNPNVSCLDIVCFVVRLFCVYLLLSTVSTCPTFVTHKLYHPNLHRHRSSG